MESYVLAHKKGYYELFKNHDNPVTVAMSLEFVNLSVHKLKNIFPENL